MEVPLLHILLAVYILSFSTGLVATTLGFFAQARFGPKLFKHIVFLFLSILLLLLAQTLKTYQNATLEPVFGNALPVIACVLTAPGNGLLVFMICFIACEVVSLPVSAARRGVHIVLALAATAAGGSQQLFQQRSFGFLNDALIGGIVIYAIVVVARRLENIHHQRLLVLIRRLVIAGSILDALMIFQTIGQQTSFASSPLGSYPLIQILFFLIITGILLASGVQFLFQQEIAPSLQLPNEIVKQYGISPRERQIITMLVQGYTNKLIGEKLFISSRTVKNHIYHIYQKTGATNKIQLLNMINFPK
jgi:DNA-binding CsgD family transcriptional regulator